jgi:hypothetical protein
MYPTPGLSRPPGRSLSTCGMGGGDKSDHTALLIDDEKSPTVDGR